jgi:hypothetical protein
MSVEVIELLITNGMAYETTDMYGRKYVCLDSLKCPSVILLKPQPVKYPCLEDCTRMKNDYPLWSPYTEGKKSPWGPGQSTVNLGYVLTQCIELEFAK